MLATQKNNKVQLTSFSRKEVKIYNEKKALQNDIQSNKITNEL